jgi:hypothetical protein
LPLTPSPAEPPAPVQVKDAAVSSWWASYGHVVIAFIISCLIVSGTIVYIAYLKPPPAEVPLPPPLETAAPAAATPPPAEVQTPKKTSRTSRKKPSRRSKPKPWLAN